MVEFNPYEAPRTDLAPVGRLEEGVELWRDGAVLVARSGARFPDRCIKCDAPAGGYRFKRTVRWHPPAYALLIIFNVILYAIVASIVNRKARIEAGLCAAHRSRRWNAILVGWLTPLLGIVVSIVGGSIVDHPAGPVVVVAGFAMIVFGIIYGIVRSRVLVPKRIDKQFVWLQKVHPDFLAPLPDWRP